MYAGDLLGFHDYRGHYSHVGRGHYSHIGRGWLHEQKENDNERQVTQFHIRYSLDHCDQYTPPHSIYIRTNIHNNKAITRYTHAHHVPHAEHVESC